MTNFIVGIIVGGFFGIIGMSLAAVAATPIPDRSETHETVPDPPPRPYHLPTSVGLYTTTVVRQASFGQLQQTGDTHGGEEPPPDAA